MNTKGNIVFGIAFIGMIVLSVISINTIVDKPVSALPSCMNDAGKRAAARVVGTNYPRQGMSVNRSAGCSQTPNSEQFVLLSSYYEVGPNSRGLPPKGPGSTLQTPNALFRVLSPGRPTAAVTVSVIKSSDLNQRCDPTSGIDVRVSDSVGNEWGSLDRNASVNVTIPAGEFVLAEQYGENIWTWSKQVRVSANNATSVHCRVQAGVWLVGGFLTLNEDSAPESAFSEPLQRYNQTNAGTGAGPKSNLGPAGTKAVALYSQLPGTNVLEYALPFKMRCDITTAQTISIRWYDPDSTSGGGSAPGTTQPAGDMGVTVYNETTGAAVLDQTIIDGNDVYGEARLTIQPNTTYTIVYYNVNARNGVQIWMPYSEIAAANGVNCGDPGGGDPGGGDPGGGDPGGGPGGDPGGDPGNSGCVPRAEDLTKRPPVTEIVCPGPLNPPFCTARTVVGDIGEDIELRATITNRDSIYTIYTKAANWSLAPGAPLNPSGGAATSFAYPNVSARVKFDAVAYKRSYTWTISGTSAGPNGANGNWTTDCTNDVSGDASTVSVTKKPYVRVYGGDVFAGGGILANDGSCSINATASAKGFMKGDANGNYRGSGVELAVFAVDVIQGVQSRSMSGQAPTYLAFSNDPSKVSISSATYNFGGGFNSTDSCVKDYYADNARGTVALSDTNISNLESGKYTIGNGAGPVTLTSPGLQDGKRIVVYVNGDVLLKGNKFGYQNNNWGNIAQIPSIYIIASGNIYINSDVSQLDGVYIAQQSGGGTTTGEIYTCATDANLNMLRNPAELFNQCGKKLTINGAFIAKQVHLLRHTGSVSESVPQETSGSAKISEVFNYSPELFLTQGGGMPSESRSVQIDSLVSLPPVF